MKHILRKKEVFHTSEKLSTVLLEKFRKDETYGKYVGYKNFFIDDNAIFNWYFLESKFNFKWINFIPNIFIILRLIVSSLH